MASHFDIDAAKEDEILGNDDMDSYDEELDEQHNDNGEKTKSVIELTNISSSASNMNRESYGRV